MREKKKKKKYSTHEQNLDILSPTNIPPAGAHLPPLLVLLCASLLNISRRLLTTTIAGSTLSPRVNLKHAGHGVPFYLQSLLHSLHIHAPPTDRIVGTCAKRSFQTRCPLVFLASATNTSSSLRARIATTFVPHHDLTGEINPRRA